jgi:hypothetical protein
MLIFQCYSYIINVREHNDYNVNEYATSFKIILCIMVIYALKWDFKWYKTQINKISF